MAEGVALGVPVVLKFTGRVNSSKMSLLSTLAMRCAIRQSSSQVERGAALEAECGIGTGGAGGLSKRSRATAPTAQIVKKIKLRAIGPRFLMRVSLFLHVAAPKNSVQYGATDSRTFHLGLCKLGAAMCR